MSLGLSLIIPNTCRSLQDMEEARRCFDDTIDRIVRYYHGHENFVIGVIMMEKDDVVAPEDIDYSFTISLLGISANMRAGYWDVWIEADYTQYFYPFAKDMFGKPRTWPRDVCFNTLLAFGQKEGWICDDSHSWNCELDDINNGFEDWKVYGESPEDSIIHEFNIMDFANVSAKDRIHPDYQYKYHDDYKECHVVLAAVKAKFPEFDILSIGMLLPNHALVGKGNDVFVIDMRTGKSLTDFPIDNFYTEFNGAGIQIFHGEESAFFNMEGNQLTDFRIGGFSWQSDERPEHPHGHIITDEATGKKFLNDGTIYNETTDNKE